MEPISLAILAGMGWLGVLARNYSTEMIKIAVEKQRKEYENGQEELQRKHRQFDIIFQNLLTRVNEERDTIQSLLSDLRTAIERSAEVDRLVTNELIEFRKTLANYQDYQGIERRNSQANKEEVTK